MRAFKVFTSFLLLTVVSCKTPKGNYPSSVGRISHVSDCQQVKPEAQNIYIQWVQDRVADQMLVEPTVISKIMALGTHESGGCELGGVNFACVKGHAEYERYDNRSGWDGTVFANFDKVKEFMSKSKCNHCTNWGGLQLSADWIALYDNLAEYLNSLAKKPVYDLSRTCLVRLAYGSSSLSSVKSTLRSLVSKRKQLAGELAVVRKYSMMKGNVQDLCSRDPECVKASQTVGLWLSACPRVSLDISYGIIKMGKGSQYWGTWYDVGSYCRDMIAQEVNYAQRSLDRHSPRPKKDSEALLVDYLKEKTLLERMTENQAI